MSSILEVISISSDSERGDDTSPDDASPVDVPIQNLRLDDSIPIYLVPKDIRHYMLSTSFLRLQSAKKLKIPITNLFIGQDTILCWHTYHWDPEYESLHSNIQDFLLTLQLSHEMGPFVRTKLLSLSKRRLAQAQRDRLCTDDLQISHDMCITWSNRIDTTEDIVGWDDTSDDTNYDADIDVPTSNTAPSDIDTESPNITSSNMETASSGMASSDMDTTSSGTSNSTEMDYEADWNIYNMTDAQHGEPKAVVNVRVGGTQSDMVDLEVYMAPEVDEDLPEIEMAIDAAGFEKYYGLTDVMDVECNFDVVNTVDGGVVGAADVSDTDMSEDNHEQEPRNDEAVPQGWFTI